MTLKLAGAINDYGKLFNETLKYKSIDLSDNTDFTYEMRLASLGAEYKNWKILPSSLHESGECWSFEKLVLASNTGIVEWYCNKLCITQQKYSLICENVDVQIIGAFYHRMKIILENFLKIIDFFSGKQVYYTFDISKVYKLLEKKNLEIKNPSIYLLCSKIKQFQIEKDKIFINYFNLEKATDLSQLALFIIIKNFK